MARVAAASTLGVALIGVWATRPAPPPRLVVDAGEVARCAPDLEAQDAPVEVRGVVVPGSVTFVPRPCEHAFRLRAQDGSGVVSVVHPGACIEPDGLFVRRPVRALVRGRVRAGVVVADEVLVQCSYRGSHGDDVGE
jgi:hypothetical protein